MGSRLNKLKLIALDTNILSYYFHSHNQFGEAAKSLVIQITTGNMGAVTSSITLAELLAIEAPTEFIKNLEKEMLAFPGLKIIEVNNKIAVKAGQIRREYRFKLADSIQLATAKIAKAQAFITNDDRLKQFKELKVILLSELAL